DKDFQLTNKLSFEFVTAGHIIGSSFVLFEFESLDGRRKRMIMTGDLGRYDEPIIPDPSKVDEADYLVVESTYGDRNHPDFDVKAKLAEIINETARRGGHILIPAFAIGRTQQLLYLIRELEEENRIPILPVFVDSPMAVSATKLYLRHTEDHDLEMKDLMNEHRNPLATKRFNLARTIQESKNVSAEEESTIVISASGMATGGGLLLHPRRRMPFRTNTVYFPRLQDQGPPGRRPVYGAREVNHSVHLLPF